MSYPPGYGQPPYGYPPGYGAPAPQGQMVLRDPAAGWGPNGPPGYNNAQAALDPPAAYGTLGGQNVPWYREPVYEPRLFFPNDATTAKQPRLRTVECLNQPAGTEVPLFINVDIPSTAYAITATAVDTTGAALPVGLDPRDTFLVVFQHTSGADRLTPQATLGSTVCGTAQFPALIGAAGWIFGRGGAVNVNITPLRTNLRINVCFWFIEIRSATNYNPPG